MINNYFILFLKGQDQVSELKYIFSHISKKYLRNVYSFEVH